MKENANWIVQFHSKDDFLVPVEQGQYVANKVQMSQVLNDTKLSSIYIEETDSGHFQMEEFENLIPALEKQLKTKDQ
jgi:hypothetical protein